MPPEDENGFDPTRGPAGWTLPRLVVIALESLAGGPSLEVVHFSGAISEDHELDLKQAFGS